MPGFEERLHQGQNSFVSDAPANPVPQDRVRDLIEARLDIRFQHPLIRAGPQKADLGDRVLCPALRAESLGTRMELRLEDRLRHQFQGRLHDPVGHCRHTEQTNSATMRLRDLHTFHRRRKVTPRGQTIPNPIEITLQILHPGYSALRAEPPSSRLGERSAWAVRVRRVPRRT